MRRLLIRLVTVSVGAGIALTQALDRDLVVRVYLLVAGGLALEALVRAAASFEPRRVRGRRRTPRDRRERPEELVRLEDQVALAVSSAGDVHYRLRPILREIADERAAARGVALDEWSAGAAWELVRPGREAPSDPFSKGITSARLAEAVAALEAL